MSLAPLWTSGVWGQPLPFRAYWGTPVRRTIPIPPSSSPTPSSMMEGEDWERRKALFGKCSAWEGELFLPITVHLGGKERLPKAPFNSAASPLPKPTYLASQLSALPLVTRMGENNRTEERWHSVALPGSVASPSLLLQMFQLPGGMVPADQEVSPERLHRVLQSCQDCHYMGGKWEGSREAGRGGGKASELVERCSPVFRSKPLTWEATWSPSTWPHGHTQDYIVISS